MKTRSVAVVFLLSLAATSSLRAEEPVPGPFSQMVNVPALVENYARFLARKYNLDETQEKATVDILQKKTQEFLAQHEGKIFELYTTMQAVRGGGEMSQDELTDWGKSAMPIYQDAKQLIVGGNAEWRNLLTDEQRKLHDDDVKLMYESFQTTDEQLARIVTGEMPVEEFRNPPKPNRRRNRRRADQQEVIQQPVAEPGIAANGQPIDPNPPAPPAHDPAIEQAHGQPVQQGFEQPVDAGQQQIARPMGDEAQPEVVEAQQPAPQVTLGKRNRASENPRLRTAVAGPNFASEWERYVQEFIRKYALDDGQQQAAMKILRDCQDQANRYYQARKTQIEEAGTAAANPAKPGEKTAANKLDQAKLLEPISRIFEKQLKPRLEKIPTRAQRQAAENPKPAADKAAGKK